MKITGIVAACYIVFGAWVHFTQRKRLYAPRRDLVATPTDIGLTYEDVWLTNNNNTQIHGWWIPHEQPRFTVLFSHGNAGNISHRLETFRILHRLGLSIFIYDYSGYGQSDGSPSEQATRSDIMAAWDWLTQKKEIAPASIILFGRSLGGAVSAVLAGQLAKDGVAPAGAIFESTFSSIPDMGAHMYPWLPVRSLARYQYNSVSALHNVHFPALFAHSQNDDIIPYAIGSKLYESYNGTKSFLELSGNHNYGYLEMGESYLNGLDHYLHQLEKNR